MKTVFLGNKNNNISRSFQNYFKYLFNREISFYCDTGYVDFEENDCIFFMEPVSIQGEWYSAFPVWIDYFRVNNLTLKVIVFHYGKKDILDSNPFFISLTDNQRSFYEKINSVLSVNNLGVGKYDFSSGSAHITDVLKVFFKGHGEESLVSTLTSIGNDLDMGPKLVASPEKYSLDECINGLIIKRAVPRRWSEFKARYNRYLAYFRYTPFFKEIQGLTVYFQKVDAYLQNIPRSKEAFIKTMISEEIRKARKILQEIDRKYIGSERTMQL